MNGEKVKILLVDDRPSNLQALASLLDQPDYELVTAASGEEALHKILREDFAVILLDVAMPKMDGFETASLIKRLERKRRIPILFVTASVYDMESIFQAYTVGAVDYLKKPLDPHQVRAKVAVFVELHRQALKIVHQAEELQKRTSQALATAEARFRRLADSGLIGIVFTTDEGVVIDANAAFLKMIGGTREELREKQLNLRDMTPPEFDDVDARAREEYTREGVFRTYGKEFMRRDGRRVAVLLGGASLSPEPGAVSFVLDISERRAVEQERAQLVAELREAVRARDDFLAVAAHELRTPLTPLRLHLGALQRSIERGECGEMDEPAAERLRGKLKGLETALTRTERLVDKLLDVSRLTVGRLQLELEEVDLAQLARETAERMRGELEQAGSALTIDAAAPIVGRWDRTRLDQVVSNLLSNAIKYGAGKPIEVAVGGDGQRAFLTVRDHGVGIARDEQTRIFDRFERLEPVRNFAGFGLGLWIVRQVIEAQGGTIELESNPGEGSSFTVKLPLQPPAQDQPAQLH